MGIPDGVLTRFFVFYFCGVHFLPASAENEPKERRSRGKGLGREKANVPHFLALQHPLPLRISSPVGYVDEMGSLVLSFGVSLAILSRSRDLT